MENKKNVIVLGNDHTNTTGVVQCMGRAGYDVTAVVWGLKTGLVKSSRYCKHLFAAATPQACIEIICEKLCDGQKAIIPCCDDAAIVLEQNKSKFGNNFHYGYTEGELTIEELCEKDRQVKIAIEAGFNTPWSSRPIESINDLPEDIVFPCITKSLMSCKGSKNDLIIVRNKTDLSVRVQELLTHTPRIILQQYIEHDYEICKMGCGLKNGDVLIPVIEFKLTQYPKNVGMVCLAKVQALEDDSIIEPIKNLIKRIRYVGLFSVELMHSKIDGKNYFTEINLRNDGGNSFVNKYGINLPLNYVEDLFEQPLTNFTNFHPGFYIWEMHHTLSMLHREISIKQWIKELQLSKGFLTYYPEDKKPFYKQYINWLFQKLHLQKNERYR